MFVRLQFETTAMDTMQERCRHRGDDVHPRVPSVTDVTPSTMKRKETAVQKLTISFHKGDERDLVGPRHPRNLRGCSSHTW